MSKFRISMAPENRAKQFAPFAALKGQEMELAKVLKTFEERVLVAEDEAEQINEVLISLNKCDEVRLTYYEEELYTTIVGVVEKIFVYESALQIKGKRINYKDICRIEKLGL